MLNLKTKLLACAVFFSLASAAQSTAQTFKTLANFGPNDGSQANPSLVQATNGNLYGTTYAGYQNNGLGTVFEVTPNGTLTTLHTFVGSDGSNPEGGLLQDSNGDLYGTTAFGGAGFGTFFILSSSGAVTTLYNFCQFFGCTDGDAPVGGLVQGTNGSLYGVTQVGGSSNDGTVYRITPTGVLTSLGSFDTVYDGFYPSQLLQAASGTLYGVTSAGGNNFTSGTVFESTPQGQVSALYTFCSQMSGTWCLDGYKPVSLIQASDGNMYGVTEFGGDYTNSVCPGSGCGTIFKITPSGTLTTLHIFTGPDGSNPSSLIQGTDGTFYGTALIGGAYIDKPGCLVGCGTVFQMSPTGTLTVLHSFHFYDGTEPSGLTQATNGAFYGTTTAGGANISGTVYRVSMGLPQFDQPIPAIGKAGTPVLILGSNLKGSTGVSFNGSAASFKVVSNTEIKASVPAGATTGIVTVTTPTGTLNSNVVFTVLP